SGPVKLNIQGQIWELKSQRAKVVVANDSNVAKLLVKDGEIEIKTHQQTKSVIKDQLLDLKTQELTHPFLYLGPRSEETIFMNDQLELEFLWSYPKSVKFEIHREQTEEVIFTGTIS